jgi:uncharacterized membrane protein
MNKTRVDSFSDCVFAFAITLLVMGIQVPDLRQPSDAALRQALIATLPQLVPYFTSFATIGIIWLNRHAMFHPVQRVEHTTLVLNLLLLLVVAFIPYPTAIVSRYGALPSRAFFYGCVLTLLGLTYTLLWRHITRRGLSSEADDREVVSKLLCAMLLDRFVIRWRRCWPCGIRVSALLFISRLWFFTLSLGCRGPRLGASHRCGYLRPGERADASQTHPIS